MKIAFVLNHFLPNQIAGTEIYTWALSKNLIKKGHEIIVIIPNFNSKDLIEYLYENIKVFSFPVNQLQDKKTIMGLKSPEGLIDFKNILSKENPDIVHFHEYSRGSGISVEHIRIAKTLNFITINTFHIAEYTCQTNELLYKRKTICNGIINIKKCSKCYLHKRGKGYLSYFLIPISLFFNLFKIDPRRWANKIGTAFGTINVIKNLKSNFLETVSLSNKIIVLTDWYYKILINNGVPQNKMHLIKQGLPYNPLDINTTHYHISNAKLKVIFIGRISFEKGLHLLIDAILQMKENDIELNIYGPTFDISYESELKNKTLNFKNIKWNGTLKKDEVLMTIQQHHLLCLCSTFSEMSPLVIQEAFSVGVPVLASNVYGNAEQIIDGVNGLLFEFNNVNSLKEKLSECIINKDLTNTLKKNITKPNSFETIGNEHILLYSSLLN